MNDNNASKGNLHIGEGVTITGTIHIPGKAVVNGILNGELTADELVVGNEGKLTGKVLVKKAEIHGQTHDTLTVQDHLMLRATGRVHGRVAYGEIEIERGGQVSGTLGPVGASQTSPPSPTPPELIPTLTHSLPSVGEEN